MKTTLEDELKYIDRCVNPDYIIVVQNKAGENMDFTQFKVIGHEDPIPKSKFRSYKAYITQLEDGMSHIQIVEVLSGGIVLDAIFKDKNKDRWEKKLKDLYDIKNFNLKPLINYESFGDTQLQGVN